MKELIYEPVLKLLSERRPKWRVKFENERLEIITDEIMIDSQILQEIQNLGFMIDEIFHSEKLGIVFFLVEKGLT